MPDHRRSRIGRWIVALTIGLMALGINADERSQLILKAFPEADRIEKDILLLDGAERARIQRLAETPLEESLVTLYKVYRGDQLLGYGFLGQETIKTRLAVYRITLAKTGTIRQVHILSWQEPPEYEPSRRWLAQFEGRERPDQLDLGGDIHAIGGATLSAETLTRAVRRAQAIVHVKLAGKE